MHDSPAHPLVAVIVADRSGIIRSWDDGATALFGHRPKNAVGASLDLIVPPEHRERHWAGFHRAMETGDCPLDRATINLPVVCADGTVAAFPARFTFLVDAHGRAAGAAGIYAPRTGDEQPFTSVQSPPASSGAS